MPIDSDPDMPGRAREAPGAWEGRGGPDAQADLEGQVRPEASVSPEALDGREARGGPEARGGREPHGGAEAAAFRQRQIAEHVRYQQNVDTVYQAAARKAWAEAVVELRGAWEEHRKRYPERVRPTSEAQPPGTQPPGTQSPETQPPETQPDAGRAVSGDRGLSPEQDAEATKACADLRDEADRVMLPAMRRVEAASPEGRLAGLEHMVKGEDRLKEKIADMLFFEPDLSARQAVDKVADAVRFTLTYSAESYTDGVLSDVDRIKAEGLELIKLKNLWMADQYKGINSQWRMPDTGTRLEMQFHTPESVEAKELTHEAYERLRRSKTETSLSEQDDLEDFQRRVNALLAIPPRVAVIKDFPEKKR